jgi:hypothetical protein
MEDRHLSLADLAGVLSPTEVMLLVQALRFASYNADEFEDSWAWQVLGNKLAPASEEAEATL